MGGDLACDCVCAGFAELRVPRRRPAWWDAGLPVLPKQCLQRLPQIHGAMISRSLLQGLIPGNFCPALWNSGVSRPPNVHLRSRDKKRWRSGVEIRRLDGPRIFPQSHGSAIYTHSLSPLMQSAVCVPAVNPSPSSSLARLSTHTLPRSYPRSSLRYSRSKLQSCDSALLCMYGSLGSYCP